jgi:hypothetical protein
MIAMRLSGMRRFALAQRHAAGVADEIGHDLGRALHQEQVARLQLQRPQPRPRDAAARATRPAGSARSACAAADRSPTARRWSSPAAPPVRAGRCPRRARASASPSASSPSPPASASRLLFVIPRFRLLLQLDAEDRQRLGQRVDIGLQHQDVARADAPPAMRRGHAHLVADQPDDLRAAVLDPRARSRAGSGPTALLSSGTRTSVR